MKLYVLLPMPERNEPERPEVFTSEVDARAALAEYVKGIDCDTETEGQPDAGGEVTYRLGEGVPAVWLWEL